MSTDHREPAGESVLFVCTANLARSPLAAALLAVQLQQARRSDIEPRSAGVHADADVEPLDEVTRVAATHGLDLDGHRPRELTRELVRAAALVLTMTEAQRSIVTRLVPAAVDRTFTLLEFARLMSSGPVMTANVHELAVAAHRARPRTAAAPRPEDIADPIGHPLRYYERLVSQLEQLVRHVSAPLEGDVPADDAFL